MSDKSDEELVGDVDIECDFTEEIPNEKPTVKQEKVTTTKQTVKKKQVPKVVPVVDDLLHAFALSAKLTPSVKKTSNTAHSSKKKQQESKSSVSTNSLQKKGDIEKPATKVETQASKIEKSVEYDFKASSLKKSEDNGNTKEVKDDEKVSEINQQTEINDLKPSASKKSNYVSDTSQRKQETKQGEVLNVKKLPKTQTGNKEGEKTNSVAEKAVDKIINQEKEYDMKLASASSKSINKMDEKPSSSRDYKASTMDRSSKTNSTKLTEKNSSATLKRKAEDLSVKDVSLLKVKKKDSSPPKSDYKKTPVKTEIHLTEDDYKNIDNHLAEQLMNKVRQKANMKSEVKYTVKVSPLEIDDLARSSVQQIIQLHPTITLIFQHQTIKFKKKKGFAEAVFSTMTELKEFVYQLTQLKLVAKKIDVLITAVKPEQETDLLSFMIHLDRNGKLLNLLNSAEDPMINKPIAIKGNPHKVQFEKVPSSANSAFMHAMFPFTNNVHITKSQVGKETKPVFHGPVSVCFVNSKWLEGAMACCTDFTVNGFHLTLSHGFDPASFAKTIDSESKAEKKNDEVVKECDENKSSESPMEIAVADEDDDADDPVSNMTRDVCVGMLESIQKLKELEPDKSTIEKIDQMQRQLNTLQKSLKKSRDGSHSKDSKIILADKIQEEKPDFEALFEEAARLEQRKEEEIQQQREQEREIARQESETKRKSQLAKLFSDFKQQSALPEKISKEAEKILQQREQRLKEKEEEEKRQKKLQQQLEEEERQKEEENRRLIERIEEARLKDSQKFSASQLLWNPSSKDMTRSSSPRGKGERASDKHSSRKEIPRSVKEGKDDGVDERLANFERELADQGKIERPATRSSTASSRSDRHYSSTLNRDEAKGSVNLEEDEYEELLVTNRLHHLSTKDYKVCVSVKTNRFCPVPGCPAKTCFRDWQGFQEHWSIFHLPETTMSFCPKCTAYFMNSEELEVHIQKQHWVSESEAIDFVRGARIKIIPNPSYRNPSPFFLPLMS